MQRYDKLKVVLDTNPKIERIFRATRRLHGQQEADRELPAPIMVVDDKPLKDYAAPSAKELRYNIIRPLSDANNFELKPSLLSMIHQNQFEGMPMNDPNLHLKGIFRILQDTKV